MAYFKCNVGYMMLQCFSVVTSMASGLQSVVYSFHSMLGLVGCIEL